MANTAAKQISLRISMHTERTLEGTAKRLGKTKTDVIRDAIDAYESQCERERLMGERFKKIELAMAETSEQLAEVLQIMRSLPTEE